MGIFDSIGPILDIGQAIAGNMFAEESQEDQQVYNATQAAITRDFNAEEAAKQRGWQTAMSSSAYQRSVADLNAAGLNPILAAYHGGGASTPSGGQASAHNAGSGIASPISRPSIAAAMQSSSQIAVNEAQAKKIEAETDLVKAQEYETYERGKTHAPNIERTQQQIRESIAQVEKILQETRTSAASAQNIEQQTRNLKESVHQIRATVQQLQSLTKLQGAMTGKTEAETTEIKQRVEAQLPQLQRILGDLERQSRILAIPGKENEASAQQSFAGSLGAWLRSINPLNQFLNQVPK